MCLLVAVAGWLLAADRALRLHFANDTVQMLRANATSRLTDAEREAVRFFSQIDGPHNVPVANRRAATLRGLLERTAR